MGVGWEGMGVFPGQGIEGEAGGSWPCCWQGALPRSVPLSVLNTPLIQALLGLHHEELPVPAG